MNKERLAIFDLDGTLFDTKDVNYYAYRYAVTQFGYSMDYTYYCQCCDGKYYLDFLPPITTDDTEILTRIHEMKKLHYAQYLDKARPNDHLLAVVRLIRAEYFTAIVTTASKENCMQLLKYHHVEGLFDKVFTHDDIVKSKPDPEGFLTAMQYFGVSSKQTIIFEDSPVGIQAAEHSGANFLVVHGFS